jgi:hypothetical protein
VSVFNNPAFWHALLGGAAFLVLIFGLSTIIVRLQRPFDEDDNES